MTAAWELHKGVNRTSDLGNLDPNDTGDERAAKVGSIRLSNPYHAQRDLLRHEAQHSRLSPVPE
jgi:hypothetical protein